MTLTTINGISIFSHLQTKKANSINTASTTLVAVPGGPGLSHTIFRPALDILAEHHQILFFDPRGTGQSDSGDRCTWTPAQFADDLVQLLKALNLTNVILYGHSGGAHICTLAALACPERVNGLVLANGVFLSKKQMFQNWVSLGGELAQHTIVECNPATMNDFLMEVAPKYDPLTRPLEHSLTLQFNPELCQTCLHDFLDLSLVELMQNITCPVHLFLGVKDPICQHSSTLEAINPLLNPRIQITHFHESGHDILLAEPDKHNAALLQFCNELMQVDGKDGG